MQHVYMLQFTSHKCCVLCLPWCPCYVWALSTLEPGFNPVPVRVKFVVDRVILGQVFCPNISVSPCHYLFPNFCQNGTQKVYFRNHDSWPLNSVSTHFCPVLVLIVTFNLIHSITHCHSQFQRISVPCISSASFNWIRSIYLLSILTLVHQSISSLNLLVKDFF